ncbi:MAG: metalloregulator ArsR/SmtB family transcription factor [Nocardioides sp.]
MARDPLSRIFAALADPTRRAVLARLLEGEATVSDLVAAHDISQPAMSKHLKVLEQAGLIRRTQHAQWRSSVLAATSLREVADWMEPYRAFWDANFDRLDAHLETMKKKENPDG